MRLRAIVMPSSLQSRASMILCRCDYICVLDERGRGKRQTIKFKRCGRRCEPAPEPSFRCILCMRLLHSLHRFVLVLACYMPCSTRFFLFLSMLEMCSMHLSALACRLRAKRAAFFCFVSVFVPCPCTHFHVFQAYLCISKYMQGREMKEVLLCVQLLYYTAVHESLAI